MEVMISVCMRPTHLGRDKESGEGASCIKINSVESLIEKGFIPCRQRCEVWLQIRIAGKVVQKPGLGAKVACMQDCPFPTFDKVPIIGVTTYLLELLRDPHYSPGAMIGVYQGQGDLFTMF
jgi:hypothetical protein